jgi:hypothetical protein
VKLHVVAGKSQTRDSETVAHSLTTDGYVRPPYHTRRTHSTGLRPWCPFTSRGLFVKICVASGKSRILSKQIVFSVDSPDIISTPPYFSFTGTGLDCDSTHCDLENALWPSIRVAMVWLQSIPGLYQFRDEVQIVSDTSAVETWCVEHRQDIKWCVNFYFSY